MEHMDIIRARGRASKPAAGLQSLRPGFEARGRTARGTPTVSPAAHSGVLVVVLVIKKMST